MKELKRLHLPPDRRGVTRRIKHSGELDIYVTVNFFPAGHPGEVFIKIGKEGSTLAGLVDMSAVLMSVMLQYGIPWEYVARKSRALRKPDEPALFRHGRGLRSQPGRRERDLLGTDIRCTGMKRICLFLIE